MNTPAVDLEPRIAELEVKLAFQDELLGSLNQIVADISATLQVTGRDLAALRRELEAQRQAQGQDPALEPPPPHY